MNVKFWLVVNSKGSIRTVKNRPGLSWDEISIHCEVKVPDAIFKRPTINASIQIPEDIVQNPQIEAETVDNVKDILKRGGIDLEINVIPATYPGKYKCPHYTGSLVPCEHIPLGTLPHEKADYGCCPLTEYERREQCPAE